MACSFGGPTPGSRASAPTDLVIGSFDFPESLLLGEIYAQGLERAGFEVGRRLGMGARELVFPALEQGLIDFVPEYAGTALEFSSLGGQRGSADPKRTHERLVTSMALHGIRVYDPAAAQDQNGFAVAVETARRHELSSLSDLRSVDSRFVFGGPPECPERPFCLDGLRRRYGVEFRSFVPLDSGGPVTISALRTGQIDIGLLFTTSPALQDGSLVLLRDDRNLQPAENVTPVARIESVEGLGARFETTVDDITATLRTRALRRLNGNLLPELENLEQVAGAWLDRTMGRPEG